MNSAEIVEKLRGIARYGYHSQPCRCQHCADNRQFLEGAIAALAAADAHAQEQARELRVLQHEHSLMEADTQRGVTDCSTPMFIRVRNIKEQLEAAEALVRTLQAERDELKKENEDLRSSGSPKLPEADTEAL